MGSGDGAARVWRPCRSAVPPYATSDLPLPPGRMPLVRDRRPLKRWRYVGVYTAELMLCVGEAHVAGLPQRWWAVALPDGTLVERTTISRGGVALGPDSRCA